MIKIPLFLPNFPPKKISPKTSLQQPNNLQMNPATKRFVGLLNNNDIFSIGHHHHHCHLLRRISPKQINLQTRFCSSSSSKLTMTTPSRLQCQLCLWIGHSAKHLYHLSTFSPPLPTSNVCQICFRRGYHTLHCYYLSSFTGSLTVAQLQALSALSLSLSAYGYSRYSNTRPEMLHHCQI